MLRLSSAVSKRSTSCVPSTMTVSTAGMSMQTESEAVGTPSDQLAAFDQRLSPPALVHSVSHGLAVEVKTAENSDVLPLASVAVATTGSPAVRLPMPMVTVSAPGAAIVVLPRYTAPSPLTAESAA